MLTMMILYMGIEGIQEFLMKNTK